MKYIINFDIHVPDKTVPISFNQAYKILIVNGYTVSKKTIKETLEKEMLHLSFDSAIYKKV